MIKIRLRGRYARVVTFHLQWNAIYADCNNEDDIIVNSFENNSEDETEQLYEI